MVTKYLLQDFGNAGSRTHEYGLRAKRAVANARSEVARLVNADPSEVLFTSGATESNNIALLGLAEALLERGATHVISTAVEHKAVLEPLEVLAKKGFSVTLVRPGESGRVDPDQVAKALTPLTGLVSVMHVNNETGVIQPLAQLTKALEGHPAYFHVDAAQGFGKTEGLDADRIDLISVSGHKIYGPKGIGALIARRRRSTRPPLTPLMVGGGQERGLRPGTLPVHLIAGLGEAARLARLEVSQRNARCLLIKDQLFGMLKSMDIEVNGDPAHTLASTLNVAIPGVDSEAALVALKGVVAISNGAACTSNSYTRSHVLEAMGLSDQRIDGSLRWSWCHMTPDLPTQQIRDALRPFLG